MGAKTRKILIAEDDPWVARLLEFSAQDLGLTAIVVRDGLEAADKFADELPDAVVTDAVLPHMDGLELSRRIKGSRAGLFTPVILFSGILHDEQEPLTRSRADAFFTKPLAPDVVAQHLVQLAPPELAATLEEPLAPAEPGEISLGAQPLPLALARLYSQRQTGTLHIRCLAGDAEILLRDGNVVRVLSSGWTESLADALVRLRRIGEEDAATLRRAGTAPDDWYEIGAAAVTAGLLATGEPERVWAAAQSMRLVEAFRWEEGFHRFRAGAVEPSTSDLPLDSAALIHWGLRRASLPEHALEQAVPSLSGKIQRRDNADELLRLLPLSRSEKWLLERADGLASLETLGRQVEGDARSTDGLVRAAISLHALGALTIDIPRLSAEPAHELIDEVPADAYVEVDYDLSGTPAQMLLTLWQAGATGIFAADTGPARYLLYLRRGQLVAARSNEIERLDSLLAQRGRIRADVLPRIRQLVESGRNVGDALLEEKAITASQLHAFIRGELRAALGELVRAQEVEVSFTELPIPDAELATHEWDTGQAVVEIARAQDLAYVQRLVPPQQTLVRRGTASELVPELALSPTERNLLKLVVTPQPWQRLTGSGLVALVDQQRALAVLITLGILDVTEGRGVESFPPERSPLSIATRRRNRELLALPEVSDEPERQSETVPRAVHEQLRREKEALEARLAANTPDENAFVPRDIYDELLREKTELKARVASLLAELQRGPEPRREARGPELAADPEEKGSRSRRAEIARVAALAVGVDD